MVTQSGLQQYTNQEKIIQVAAHNLEIASELRDGELQFTHVFVDLERICNLACHGCFKLMNTDRTQMKLDYEEVKNIVDFGQEREAGVIVIAGAGEPTLDKHGNLYFTHHFYKDNKMIEADIYVSYLKK